MSDLADQIQESVERGPESRMNAWIALMVALAATFMALCNVKDGNVVQAMAQAQVKAVDQWSYYQAKSTKQHIAENAAQMLEAQIDLAPKVDVAALARVQARIAAYRKDSERYGREKEEAKTEAQRLEKSYDDFNIHDDQFDMAEACLSVGIALFGITALTRVRWLFGLASVFAGFGIAFGLSGFLGWNLHPDWLAKLLS